MRRNSIAAGLATTMLFLSVSHAEPPKDNAVTIPLDRIWAYKMPDTRDIQELDKENIKDAGKPLIDPISVSLVERGERLKWKGMARPGFAVSGTGVLALRAAHRVLVEGAKPGDTFSQDESIAIVFFSEPAGRERVQIRRVDQKKRSVEIQFRLERYYEANLSLNLALIPLGKLPPGKYRVEMNQLPREQKLIERGIEQFNEEWGREFLCKPFTFIVSDKRA